ncbi:MAG: FAD-dependent oxidoreductase, partial [Dehalococcoidia bacterium]|nr:FAD-dependent oxidoreductase [Dehalococcoidia bacterium]
MPDQVIIMGAGPAGLACAYELTAHDLRPIVVERSPWVGGLARTIEHDGFRFDIGGHRWFTKNDEIHEFFVNVVADEIVWVNRISRIYYDGKFFYYPLRVTNALAGMGLVRSARAVLDHIAVRLRPIAVNGEATMEQAYTNQFGRTLYQQFFRSYSEKVWGLPCDQISGDWVAQRSKGLSLTAAIKDAFAQSRGEYESLVDRFAYPALGIGRFSERMADTVRARGGVIELNARVTKVHHDGNRVTGVTVRRPTGDTRLDGSHFVSSIPITSLIHAMSPPAP